MNIVEFLCEKGLTIATAESCTGGMISNLITDCAGSSNCFEMGLVTYSNEAKVNLLGISSESLKKYGAVSPEIALDMSRCIRKLSNADIGIASTGYAENDGVIFISLCAHNLHLQMKYNFNGTRLEIKEQAAKAAIDMVFAKTP